MADVTGKLLGNRFCINVPAYKCVQTVANQTKFFLVQRPAKPNTLNVINLEIFMILKKKKNFSGETQA